MPGVKKQHQTSSNNNKPDLMYGHHFGSVGILIGQIPQTFCALVSNHLHEGVEKAREWQGEPKLSRVEALDQDALSVAGQIDEIASKGCYLALDRDFFAKATFQACLEYNETHENHCDVVVRCKTKTKVRRELTEEEQEAIKVERQGQRGRRPKYTPAFHIIDLPEMFPEEAQSTTINTRDGEKTYQYWSMVAEWHKMTLLFVVSVDEKGNVAIYATTDLTLDPALVIQIYKLRFDVEITFRDMHELVNAYDYRFWCKDLEKLTKYSKDRLASVPKEKQQGVIDCIKRIERFVTFAGVALSILQVLALSLTDKVDPKEIRYQRTYRTDGRLTTSQVKEYLHQFLPTLLVQEPESMITNR